MEKIKKYYRDFKTWLEEKQGWIYGILMGLMLGFLEFLALAPYHYVEWFYGPKKEPKPEKEMHIIYKNGVPTDTIIIEKYGENIMFDNNNSKLYGI